MTSHLLDTCVIIDSLRGRPAAMTFLASLEAPPAISVVTATELYTGVRSHQEEENVRAMIGRLDVCNVTLPIARQAGLWHQRFRRSHGLAIPDALIAATAEAHGLCLVTRNIRHFPMLDDVLVPYR